MHFKSPFSQSHKFVIDCMWNSRSSEHLSTLKYMCIYGEPMFGYLAACVCYPASSLLLYYVAARDLWRFMPVWAVSHNLNYARRIGFHIVIFCCCIQNALKKCAKALVCCSLNWNNWHERFLGPASAFAVSCFTRRLRAHTSENVLLGRLSIVFCRLSTGSQPNPQGPHRLSSSAQAATVYIALFCLNGIFTSRESS